MPKGLLQKLRSKTPEEKKKITIWTAAAVVLLLAVLWALYLTNSFRQNNSGRAGRENSFFADIKKDLGNILKSAGTAK